MTTIGKTGLSATKLYTLLPDFVGKNISYAQSWLNSHNINGIEIEYEESEKDDGTILSQSLPQYKRIDLIKQDIVFVVAKQKEEEKQDQTPTPDPIEDEENSNNQSENSENEETSNEEIN
mgnify:FL=1